MIKLLIFNIRPILQKNFPEFSDTKKKSGSLLFLDAKKIFPEIFDTKKNSGS